MDLRCVAAQNQLFAAWVGLISETPPLRFIAAPFTRAFRSAFGEGSAAFGEGLGEIDRI